MRLIHNHTHFGWYIDAEARLCHEVVSDRPAPAPAHAPKENPWEKRWDSVKEFLYGVTLYVGGYEKGTDPAILANLTNDAQWVQIFRAHPDVFSQIIINDEVKKFNPHIAAFLEKISIQDRQRIYLEYIDQWIPEEQQIKLDISGLSMTPEQRIAKIFPDKVPLINAIFGAMVGTGDWRSTLSDQKEIAKAESIAKEGLTKHYKDDGMNYPDTVNTNLELDVETALGYDDVAEKFRNAGANPDILKGLVSESRLLGALKLGVIDQNDLERLQAHFEQKDHLGNLVTSRASAKLETLTEATKLQQKVEARGISDMWNSMSGNEKFILMAIGGGVLLASKWARNIAGGIVALLGGAYVFQKLILKQDDPMRNWDALVGKATGMLTGANKLLPGKETPTIDVDGIAYKSNLMIDFFDDFDRENLETQAVGFGILANVPLAILAKNFVPVRKDGSAWGMDFRNPTLSAAAKDALKASKWKESAYRNFFADPRNVVQINEGMGYIFYTMAAQNPKWAEEVLLIEDVRGKLPSGSSLSHLGELNSYDYSRSNPELHSDISMANEAYIRMVWDGQQDALSNNKQTIQQYIMETLKILPVGRPAAPDMIAARHVADDFKGDSVDSDASRASVDGRASSGDAVRGVLDEEAVIGTSESAGEGGTSDEKVERAGVDEKSRSGSSDDRAIRGAAEGNAEGAISDVDASYGESESDAERGRADTDTRTGESEVASGNGIDVDANSGSTQEAQRKSTESLKRGSAESAKSGASENAKSGNSETPKGGNFEAGTKGNSPEGRGGAPDTPSQSNEADPDIQNRGGSSESNQGTGNPGQR